MLRRVLAISLSLLAPLLAACAIPALIADSFGEHGFPTVDETAEAYNQDLRWGRLQQAAAQMAPEQREPFFALFDGDPGPFRFTSVEVLSAVPKGIGGREVDVLVVVGVLQPARADRAQAAPEADLALPRARAPLGGFGGPGGLRSGRDARAHRRRARSGLAPALAAGLSARRCTRSACRRGG